MASHLGSLGLCSSTFELLRHVASLSIVGTPWRRPSSSLFFLGYGGVEAPLARSASSPAGSASVALPSHLLPPAVPLLWADADIETIFSLWLALSGWLFRIFIFGTFVLPFAVPLLLGPLANRVAIEGTCPACKRRFVGYRNQVIRCMNCQNIVWQPNNSSSGGTRSSRSSEPDVIDVEYEEK